mmetsp:Transcript_3534/g.9504  ORF Transcript_3534/g.9504 Transcript_3534/m.9504 type:complete len:280 (-) Transcript_3534:385-1224(-)
MRLARLRWYRTRSAIVHTLRLFSLANARSASRFMHRPVSRSMISQMSPAAEHFASFVRSTAASVCPGRFSTPPRLARRGRMCPGLAKSSGMLLGFASARVVAARSDAEIPVVVPCRRSTVVVNAVDMDSSFSCDATMSGSRSLSHSSGHIATHASPLVLLTRNAICSVVHSSAAMMRSPSFSRSSSSSTTTNRPSAISAMHSSMASNPSVGSSRFLVWLKAAASSSSEGDVEGEDDDPFPLLSSFVSSSEVVCCEAAVRATCVLPRPLTGVVRVVVWYL